MICEHKWQFYTKEDSIVIYRTCTKCHLAQQKLYGGSGPGYRSAWFRISNAKLVFLLLSDKLTPTMRISW